MDPLDPTASGHRCNGALPAYHCVHMLRVNTGPPMQGLLWHLAVAWLPGTAGTPGTSLQAGTLLCYWALHGHYFPAGSTCCYILSAASAAAPTSSTGKASVPAQLRESRWPPQAADAQPVRRQLRPRSGLRTTARETPSPRIVWDLLLHLRTAAERTPRLRITSRGAGPAAAPRQRPPRRPRQRRPAAHRGRCR